jgi:hypothetical protein
MTELTIILIAGIIVVLLLAAVAFFTHLESTEGSEDRRAEDRIDEPNWDGWL